MSSYDLFQFFFCGGLCNFCKTPPAQGEAEGSVRLQLTKNPARSISCPLPLNYAVSRVNGSRGPDRLFQTLINLCAKHLRVDPFGSFNVME